MNIFLIKLKLLYKKVTFLRCQFKFKIKKNIIYYFEHIYWLLFFKIKKLWPYY